MSTCSCLDALLMNLCSGADAPCSYQFFSVCSLLLSTFCQSHFFYFFFPPFSFSCAPFCFLIFISCSRMFFSGSILPLKIYFCSMLLFMFLEYFVIPALGLWLSFYWFLLLLGLAPCQIGHAPCSRITPNRGPLLLTEKANIEIYVVEIHELILTFEILNLRMKTLSHNY